MNGEVIGVTQMINKKIGIFTGDDEQLLSSFSAQGRLYSQNNVFSRLLTLCSCRRY
jgi:hypothetical protein